MVKRWLKYETEAKRQGFRFILGVDEAGRGPLAGPVVAAAVCLKDFDFTCRIDDSKKLNPAAREKACGEIFQMAYVGIGIISEAAIDRINILNATFRAMEGAVSQLIKQISRDSKVLKNQVKILVDGNIFKSKLPYEVQTIVDGDGLSLSIACASIIAKVYRDRMMNHYDRIFPQYGFKNHKGYATLRHRQAIAQHGLSLIHRKSFQTISQ